MPFTPSPHWKREPNLREDVEAAMLPSTDINTEARCQTLVEFLKLNWNITPKNVRNNLTFIDKLRNTYLIWTDKVTNIN